MKNHTVVITEPAAAAALKNIYKTNGPGELKWDFSVPGQVTAQDGRLKARDGALTRLNLSEAGLKGVLKLHGVDDLKGLDAAVNDLMRISFKNLPGLARLYIPVNEIIDLPPLAWLTKLISLVLRENEISDLSPLAGLTKLTHLHMIGNKISDLSSLAGLTELAYLYLEENKISDLSPLAGLVNLREIDLENCPVTDLSPLDHLPELEKVNGQEYRRPA